MILLWETVFSFFFPFLSFLVTFSPFIFPDFKEGVFALLLLSLCIPITIYFPSFRKNLQKIFLLFLWWIPFFLWYLFRWVKDPSEEGVRFFLQHGMGLFLLLTLSFSPGGYSLLNTLPRWYLVFLLVEMGVLLFHSGSFTIDPVEFFPFHSPIPGTYLGIVHLLSAPLGFLSFRREEKGKKLEGMLILFSGFILLIFFQSRTALLSYFLFFGLFFLLRWNSSWWKWFLLTSFFLGEIFPLFYIFLSREPYFLSLDEEVFRITGKRLFSGRQEIWRSAMEKGKENVFLGEGPGKGVVYDFFRGGEFSPHNLFLHLRIEVGVVGEVLYFLALYGTLKHFFSSLKRWSPEETIRAQISVAFFLTFLFVQITEVLWGGYNFYVGFWGWVVTAMGFSTSAKEMGEKNFPLFSFNGRFLPLFLIYCGIFFPLSIILVQKFGSTPVYTVVDSLRIAQIGFPEKRYLMHPLEIERYGNLLPLKERIDLGEERKRKVQEIKIVPVPGDLSRVLVQIRIKEDPSLVLEVRKKITEFFQRFVEEEYRNSLSELEKRRKELNKRKEELMREFLSGKTPPFIRERIFQELLLIEEEIRRVEDGFFLFRPFTVPSSSLPLYPDRSFPFFKALLLFLLFVLLGAPFLFWFGKKTL